MLVIWIKLLQLWDRVLGCSLVRGTGFFSLEEGRFSVPIGQRQRSDVSRAKLFDYRTKGWIDMASRWVRGKTLALEACEALHASIAFTCLHQLRDLVRITAPKSFGVSEVDSANENAGSSNS